jgi:hypothetical protein
MARLVGAFKEVIGLALQGVRVEGIPDLHKGRVDEALAEAAKGVTQT